MSVPLCCVRGVYTVCHFMYMRCCVKNKVVDVVIRRLMTGDTFLEMHR